MQIRKDQIKGGLLGYTFYDFHVCKNYVKEEKSVYMEMYLRYSILRKYR